MLLLLAVPWLGGCPPPPDEGGGAVLRALPTSLDFGEALFGVATTGTVAVVNDGDVDWAPSTPPAIEGPGAAAFTISGPCALPLAPEALCNLEVTFLPTEPGAHEATLVLVADEAVRVPLTGAVRGVRFTPAALDFGPVKPGAPRVLPLTMENVGTDAVQVPLRVEGAGFRLMSSNNVALAPGESAELQVEFGPTVAGAADGRLTADLCPDADCDPAVALSGAGAYPEIALSPVPVDFGAVAAGDSADRVLEIANLGAAELEVSALQLSDDSGFVSIQDAPTLPFAVAAGGSQAVTLRYAPTQGLANLAATLTVLSDDPAEEAGVALSASTPGSGLVASPVALDFGTLDEGATAERDVTLISSGTESAVIESLDFGTSEGSFVLVGTPPTLPYGVPPGANLTLRLRARAGPEDLAGRADLLRVTLDTGATRDVPLAFAGGQSGCAPTVTLAFVDLGNVAVGTAEPGALRVRNAGTAPCVLQSAVVAPELTFAPELSFDASGLATIAPGELGELRFLASADAVESYAGSVDVTFQNVAPLRLTAFAAGVEATLFPEVAAVDLGVLPDGCVFGEQAIVVQNLGDQPEIIDSIAIEPAGSPFVILDGPPAFPAGLEAGRKEVVVVGRVEAPEGSYAAALVIRGSANVVRVPLAMEVAAPGTPIVQRFAAPSSAALDILFVIDNSGSMYDDQEELADNFQYFVAEPRFSDGSIDLHLGVTTTDTSLAGERGRVIGNPPVITSDTPNLAAAFGANARVGTSGSSDEAGLSAMQLALTEPNLSGDNADFYRPHAALAVVIVTDEEDYSASDVQSYVDFLRNVKGGGLTTQMINLSAALDLTYGTSVRYQEAVAAFGGQLLDLGVDGWGQSLGTLADALADLPQIFTLGGSPLGGTAVVTVDGVTTTDLQIDEPNGMVALGTPASVGAVVEVTYHATCSPP